MQEIFQTFFPEAAVWLTNAERRPEMNNLPEPVRSIVDDLNDLKDPILASAVESLCLSKDFHNLSSLELINQLLLPV